MEGFGAKEISQFTTLSKDEQTSFYTIGSNFHGCLLPSSPGRICPAKEQPLPHRNGNSQFFATRF